MTETVMDAAELCRARDALGFTDEKLAADLGLPPNVVSAWSSGRAKVPRHIARDLRWRAAVAEQERMLAESGLPACEWVTAFEAQPVPEKLEARVKRFEELEVHARVCPACVARDAYAEAHFPPLPERPLPLWMKGAGLLVSLADRLPKWAEPAVWVGAAFGAYSLFRIVFLLPRLVAHPREWLIALAGLTASISIGAVLGALYGGGKHLWAQLKARRRNGPATTPRTG
jgi:transcriptional regulator with XRE-family HTH domain